MWSFSHHCILDFWLVAWRGSFPAFDLIKRLPIIMCIMTAVYHVNIFSFCCAVLHILKFSFSFATYLFLPFQKLLLSARILGCKQKLSLAYSNQKGNVGRLVGSRRIARKVEKLGSQEGKGTWVPTTLWGWWQAWVMRTDGIHSHSVSGTTACPPSSPLLVAW